jgi:hypothetical protein
MFDLGHHLPKQANVGAGIQGIQSLSHSCGLNVPGSPAGVPRTWALVTSAAKGRLKMIDRSAVPPLWRWPVDSRTYRSDLRASVRKTTDADQSPHQPYDGTIGGLQSCCRATVNLA